MKRHYLAAGIILVFASFNSIAYGNTTTEAGSFPYIVSSVQFPQTEAEVVRHTFRLQTPQRASAIEQLSIDVPYGLKVKNNISVSDHLNKKIETNTTVNSSKIRIIFFQPLAPGNKININLNTVIISGVTNAWLYPISARFVGIDADLPLGVAQIRFY